MTAPLSPQSAWAMHAGISAAVAGYALLEALETCRRQAMPGPQGVGKAPFNQIDHSPRPWTHLDRDFNTPTVDLLYSNAWTDLRQGPVILNVPAWNRFFVVELLDVYTNNFLNLGTRNVPKVGARYALLAPGSNESIAPAGTIPVICPTALVWLLGRVFVDGEVDLEAARKIQLGFRLEGSSVSAPSPALAAWHKTDDAATDFWANLARALSDFPALPDQRAPFDLLASAHIKLPADGDLSRLRPATLEGLRLAHAKALELIEGHTRSPSKAPWRFSTRLGRFGSDYMLRAATAMKGIGALAADEAVYATADFDHEGEPLHGRHRYRLRFADGGDLPANAFWSITLYGEDRFLAANTLGRHALGNRSALASDEDGSLSIHVSHEKPDVPASNWLPAPDEAFYLILRIYHPQERLTKYVFPEVERLT